MSVTEAAPVGADHRREAPPTENLLDFVQAIPDSCRERSVARGLGLVARDLLIYAATLTALVLTDTWWLLLPLWTLAGMVVAGMFVLGHDAAHGALFDQRWLNRAVGLALFVPSQHIYESWVLGHNRVHHRFTARQGVDFVWHPVTPDEYAELSRGRKLLHRIEWSAFGAGVYYLRSVWWQKMIRLTEPPKRFEARIRRDRRILRSLTLVVLGGTVGVALLGGSSLVGTGWLIVKLFVVPFLAFNWFIGFSVYIHHIGEDMPWPARSEWTKVAGQLDSTKVFRIPWVFDLFFHGIFLHVPHHVDQRVPCYHLDEAATALETAFPGRVIDTRLRFRDYIATTRACKLYDFDAGRWHTFDSAAASLRP